MQPHEEALYIFIDEMGYLKNPDVLGIVFCGSYLTGYNVSDSDLDVHVIMDNSIEKLIRGALTVIVDKKKYKIEYFEKPIGDLHESVENEFENQSNALLAIIGHGKIMFDRNDGTKEFQDYIIEKYSEPMPPISDDTAKELVCIIDNRMVQLEKMLLSKNRAFNSLYYTTIEKIRKFYHKLCGCPEIPDAKVERLYDDEEYREAFSKGHIPEPEFIESYYNAKFCDGSDQKKLAQISDLYDYSRRNLDLDVNNCRMYIISRNNPYNPRYKL